MRIRAAQTGDTVAVAVAVESLLLELGAHRPPRPAIEAEIGALIADARVGELLVAAGEGDGGLVGVLAASWGRAIHVPGRYATIQDLWVHRDWRSRGVGAELVAALAARARAQGVERIEVGLPRETFAAIAQTEAFYRGAGFEPLGPRMRLLLNDGGDRVGPLSRRSRQTTNAPAGEAA